MHVQLCKHLCISVSKTAGLESYQEKQKQRMNVLRRAVCHFTANLYKLNIYSTVNLNEIRVEFYRPIVDCVLYRTCVAVS